jgi:hypothetical protein
MSPAALAKAQGLFHVVMGAWPLLRYRSFEAVTGPKAEPWLVKTVGGLMVTLGYAQMRGAMTEEGMGSARRLGLGSAATFAAVDIFTAGPGRISRIYLLDAVVQFGWMAAWTVWGRRKFSGVGPRKADVSSRSYSRLR